MPDWNHCWNVFIKMFMFVARSQSPGAWRFDRERSHLRGLLEVTLQSTCHSSILPAWFTKSDCTRLTMPEDADGVKCCPWQTALYFLTSFLKQNKVYVPLVVIFCDMVDSCQHLLLHPKSWCQKHGWQLQTVLQCQKLGGDEAQLVEHRTGMLLTQVRSPGAARDFSPRVNFNFSADCLMVSIHPRVQSHASTSVCMLKILWSMSEFGGLWKH